MDPTLNLAMGRLEDLVNRAAEHQKRGDDDLVRLLLIEAESICMETDSKEMSILTLPRLHNRLGHWI